MLDPKYKRKKSLSWFFNWWEGNLCSTYILNLKMQGVVKVAFEFDIRDRT